jgi:hypothetical protein
VKVLINMNPLKLIRNLIPAIAVLALIPTASATQPTIKNVRVSSNLRPGTSSLHLVNLTKRSVAVSVRSGPLSTLTFEPQRVFIAAGAEATAYLGDLFSNAQSPVQALQVLTDVAYDNGRREEAPVLYEMVRIGAGGIEKISYGEAYLSRQVDIREVGDPVEADMGAGYVERSPMPTRVFAARPLDPMIRVEQLGDLPEIEELLKLELNQVGDPGPVTMDDRALMDSRRAASFAMSPGTTPDFNPNGPVTPVKLTLKGNFFVKYPHESGFVLQKAAWGWSARVWEWVDGMWKYRGTAEVNKLGNWKGSFQFVELHPLVRVIYQPVNRFVSFRKTDGTAYGWTITADLANGTDLGHYMADLTGGGDAPGMEYLFHRSMLLWAKLSKNGINPLLPAAIPVTFPNDLTTGECELTDDDDKDKEYPWSCATSQRIYIIPEHARGGTGPHELAHVIHRHYWGKFPKGSGGKHDPRECYNAGMALTEGFANYIAYWTTSTYDRLDTSARWDLDVESLDSKDFCWGSSNEMRVTALMWDTFDGGVEQEDIENRDVWRFLNPAGFISIFLKNPNESILEYRFILRTGATEWFKEEVDRTLRLNKLIL